MGPVVNPSPGQRWTFADYAALAVLVAAAGVLFFSGLSWRSLWGSEGRWAVIAREMMLSGNYFLPTINGVVYFDKPLLSYWAIVPFSLFSGVTEMSARIPNVLAGMGTVAIVFAIGRGLFGLTPGLYAGLVLLTTAMFGFWSRTASAEILNVLAIWSMLWVLQGRGPGRPFHRYLFFYLIAAVSSFCKGPLAPAVAVAAVIAVNCVEMVWDIRQDGFGRTRRKVTEHFDWILSQKGILAAVCGLALFALLLFLPVIMTGSREAVELMWRENVVRFLEPFDHVEPFYIYFKHIPVFLIPWTFLGIGALIHMKRWGGGPERRWLATVTIAIFLFFTLSGSRRSYYILPLIPAFALIIGRSLAGFLERERENGSPAMKTALVVTAFIPVIAGVALVAGYFGFEAYRHFSEVIAGPVIVAAGVAALFFIVRRMFVPGSTLLVLLFFGILLWTFTAGTLIGERGRGLKPFAHQVASRIEEVSRESVAMYGVGNSSFLFYLDRKSPLRALSDLREVCSFAGGSGRHLVTEEAFIWGIEKECGPRAFERVLSESPGGGKKRRNDLVLLVAPKGP
ncbi:MAG: Undecaprenyl phosphate-alpha-4-amino-4-deoxy-L-arabinose arabinosyl transferase [Syntrophorhabdus sp. PtaB.Bin184]|nr:MAG: Undecaprenyl phosphate-alpha-4-amino-4-deoxy-L-arabinose arabinosyl transferase [Syntrophorhabdus sp. PtaB.Bin184]